MTNVTALPSANSKNDIPASNRFVYLFIGLTVLAVVALIIWLSRPAYEPFTIAEGEGLNAHVSYEQAIDLAEKNGIPLVFGSRWGGPPISYDGARALEGTLDANQVTVLLKPGDHFDEDGVYHPASRQAFVGDDGLTIEQREMRLVRPVGN